MPQNDKPFPVWAAGVFFLLVGGAIIQVGPVSEISSLLGLTSLVIGVSIFLYAEVLMKREGAGKAFDFLKKDSSLNPPEVSGNREYRNPDNRSEAKQKRKELTQRRKDEIIYERAGEECEVCGLETEGESLGLHVHHIKPLSEGGTNNKSNLIALCPNCHDKAHSGAFSENELRYKVGRSGRN